MLKLKFKLKTFVKFAKTFADFARNHFNMLQEKLKNKNLILASKSPRRQDFVKNLNIDFTIQLKEVEEIYSTELKGKQITDYLAKLKSEAFTDLKKDDILVTSDTIVWFKGKALEKPKDREDAVKMLQKLSGKKHKVLGFKTLTQQTLISN